MYKTLAVLIIFFYLSPILTRGQELLLPQKVIDTESLIIEAQKKRIIGDTDGEIRLYKQILELDPNDDVASYYLGKAYQRLQNYTEATNYYSLALVNNKENPWYYISAAECYLQNDQIRQATHILEELVAKFDQNKEYYDRLAYVYHQTGQYNQELSVIDRMIDQFGFHKSYFLGKVEIYNQLKEYDKAIETLNQLINQFPKDKLLLNLLANLYLNNGQENKAREVFEAILSMDPQDADAQLALHEFSNKDASPSEKILRQQGLFENESIEFDQKFPLIAPLLQNDLNQLSKEELQTLDQVSQWLLQSHPNDPKAMALRADIYAHQGQNNKAADLYAQTIAIYPENYLVWEQLFWSLKELLQWSKLAEFTDEALIYFPNKATVYFMKAMAAYHLQSFDDALFELSYAQKLAAEDPVLLSSLVAFQGLVECSASEKNNEDHFQKARTVLSQNPNIDYFQSLCAFHQSDYTQSLTLILQAIKKVPEHSEYNVHLAKTYHKMGQTIKAIECLSNISDQSTYYPVFQLLSQLYDELGDKEKSKNFHSLAIEYGMPYANDTH